MDTQLINKDECYTPKWLFDQMKVNFDIDVAAPEGGIPWIPAKKFYTQKENGLEQSWYGNVWMNPPYSHTTPWVHKFIENGSGICLLVVSKSKWFQTLWDTADAIVPSIPTLKFERPENEKPVSISFQTFLFAMGEENVEGLKRLGNARVR